MIESECNISKEEIEEILELNNHGLQLLLLIMVRESRLQNGNKERTETFMLSYEEMMRMGATENIDLLKLQIRELKIRKKIESVGEKRWGLYRIIMDSSIIDSEELVTLNI